MTLRKLQKTDYQQMLNPAGLGRKQKQETL